MLNRRVTDLDQWRVAGLDLDAYLARIGVPAVPPSRGALDRLHEAHVRAFTFDNIDVLLDQHPGVALEAVQAKFVRITQTGAAGAGEQWAIAQARVFAK